jgi:RNA polymerase sigma-70 factor, ECF subfamily
MRQLVELARTGDREAFAQLAAIEINRLNAIARLVLGDADLADDAVQETLVRCWQNLPKLRDVDRFTAWINQILMRAVADQRRGRRRFQVSILPIGAEPSGADSSIAVADRDELERAFGQLSVLGSACSATTRPRRSATSRYVARSYR